MSRRVMVQGSLAIRNGILYVGRHAKTAHVREYDLDGHPLGSGFAFGAVEGASHASAAGLAVDDEHRVWVADTPAARLRAFSLFGLEVAGVGGRLDEGEDRAGRLGPVVDVATPDEGAGPEAEGVTLCVAGGGKRRHGLQLFDAGGELRASLRPRGHPQAAFEDLCGIDWRGRFVYACERRAGRVQVFRDGDFHFLFQLPAWGGAAFEPTSIAALADGRMVIGQGGESHSALLLVDSAGELLSIIAGHGRDGGQVFEPAAVVVEEGRDDRHTRVIALDCDADRVQVFNLNGRCYGSFRDLPYVTS